MNIFQTFFKLHFRTNPTHFGQPPAAHPVAPQSQRGVAGALPVTFPIMDGSRKRREMAGPTTSGLRKRREEELQRQSITRAIVASVVVAAATAARVCLTFHPTAIRRAVHEPHRRCWEEHVSTGGARLLCTHACIACRGRVYKNLAKLLARLLAASEHYAGECGGGRAAMAAAT